METESSTAQGRPDYEPVQSPEGQELEAVQEVPTTLERRRTPQPEPAVVRVRVPSKFDVLKSKAEGAVGEMKRKFTESVTPRTLKKKPKGKKKGEAAEEPEVLQVEEAESPPEESMEVETEKEEKAVGHVETPAEPEKKEEGPIEPEVELTPEEKEQAALLQVQKAKEAEEKEKAKQEDLQRKEEEKLEKERAKDEERLEKEKAKEAERLEKEKAKEEERLNKLKAKEEERLRKEQEKAKKEKAKEEERIKKEKQKEEERIKKEKAKEEEKKRKEEERIAKEKKKEEERIAKEKAKEEERLAKEKAKEEKLAKEKQKEEERLAKEKAKEEERLEKEKLKEEERLAKEAAKLEAEALAKEKAGQETEGKDLSEPKSVDEGKSDKLEDEAKPTEDVQESATATEDESKEKRESSGEKPFGESSEDLRGQHSRTPSLTRGRGGKKVKLERREIPLPQITLPKLDFTRKVIKRSRTPPAKSLTQPKKVAKKGSGSIDHIACDEDGKPIKNSEGDENVSDQVAASDELKPEEQTEEMEAGPSGEQRESEQGEMEPRVVLKDPPVKEKFDKIEQKLNKIGKKSKNIAAQTTMGVAKGVGKTIKVLGKDLYKFGVIVNEKCQTTVEDIIAKQEIAKEKARLKAEQEEEARLLNSGVYDEVSPPEESTEAQPSSSQLADEQQQFQQHLYENDFERRQDGSQSNQTDQPGKLTRSQLLGRAERDWESPLDLVRSRDGSEEPVSGMSSRDSPPPSSVASSSAPHVRRKGVLEEIDSDEFFLRERGISEGEDAEEVNRVLAEELRQTFRPTISNALAGLDADPPSRPDRSPRKPPRKSKDDSVPNFQTFPPERPKRKKVTGYVSSYMAEHEDDEMELMEDDSSNREDGDSMADEEEDSEYESEGIRRVKEELSKIDRALEEEEEAAEQAMMAREQHGGPYEQLVQEEPQKPSRSRKKQPRSGTPPSALYYNTIASHEWMQDVEGQILAGFEEDSMISIQPTRPPRDIRNPQTREAGPSIKDRESSPFDEPINEDEIVQGHLRLVTVMDNLADLVDEGGYAIVQKEEPSTIPRKKRKDKETKDSSTLQHSEADERAPSFFSLPRFTPTMIQVSPPTRPHRNTYSTLSPRRPPRSKSKGNLPGSPPPENQESSDDPRPSSAIGIGMQGRPLPPVPRPADRTSPPLNDLDQNNIEQALGLRHYANFDGIGDEFVEVQEPLCIARNIPLLGRPFGDEREVIQAISSENVGVQTDPMRMLEEDARNILSSFEVDGNNRIDMTR